MRDISKHDLLMYYKFANKIIKKKQNLFITFNNQTRNDAVEEGLLGIVDGVMTFDETKDCQITTYIYKCMENKINNFIVNFNNKMRISSIPIEDMEISSNNYNKESQYDSDLILKEIDTIMLKIKNKDPNLSVSYRRNGELLYEIYNDVILNEQSLTSFANKKGISHQALSIHKKKLLSYLKYQIKQKYGEFLR